jgi:hypothetical protein
MSEDFETDPEELALEDLELDDLEDDDELLVPDGPEGEFLLRTEEHELVPIDDEVDDL